MDFNPRSILQSGIFIPGNGKALVKLSGANNQYLMAASQNRGPLKVFRLKKSQKIIQLAPMDVKATIRYKNGNVSEQEFYYGSSFLSQSGRFIRITDQMAAWKLLTARVSSGK